MTLEQAFQHHLDNLPEFLGVPIAERPWTYAKDLADSIKYPGHQHPRHKRCETVRYISSTFCMMNGDSAEMEKSVGDFLEKVKPDIRKLIEGVAELHSADWQLRSGDGSSVLVIHMYVPIGDAYQAPDKPKPVPTAREVESKDHYSVCPSCKNTDTKLLGAWDDGFNAGVSTGRWAQTDHVRSCHCCGAVWVSDKLTNQPL